MARYETTIRHDGLHKFRVIKGDDRELLRQRASAISAQWEEMWQRKQEREQQRSEREERAEHREHRKAVAEERTEEAKAEIEAWERLLKEGVEAAGPLNWDLVRDMRPLESQKPQAPAYRQPPPEPSSTERRFQPRLGILGRLFGPVRRGREEDARGRYTKAYKTWHAQVDEVQVENKYLAAKHQQALNGWEAERTKQAETNKAIDDARSAYENKSPNGIEQYCEFILSASRYPPGFAPDFDLQFMPDTGVVIVDYRLPGPGDIPTLTEVQYLVTKDETREKHLSESAKNRLYDKALYQIALRSMHELFASDEASALTSIVFNGWVDFIDGASGKPANACIMSLQVARDEWSGLDLRNVDPKQCFRAISGVGSSKLHAIAPVAPLVRMNKEDARFVHGYAVEGTLEDDSNLATMDWQDFENLVRDLFENEFSKSGGEVKITRGSRDGGVDAVAFDPDPIRGGKIVIQAKRYINTVGVDAVRDLYGTVINEGATKGILVTTSRYGADAYAFAKGKPLTLLDGGNLVHLLAKHGHEVRIDLAAARSELIAPDRR